MKNRACLSSSIVVDWLDWVEELELSFLSGMLFVALIVGHAFRALRHCVVCELHVSRIQVIANVTLTSPSSSASTTPSPHQGPITRSTMRKIHMGLSQDDQVNHGLFTLFTWAKEISKI